jgi:hypothetical protein
MIRKPVVAGQFYPGHKATLHKMLKDFFSESESLKDIKAAIVPHAGYIYSGKVAASLYSMCPKDIEVAVIIGPNHTGLGSNYSLMESGAWSTPLGEVSIDEKLARDISQKAEILKNDFEAHRLEHSIEVQLPFLQFLNPEIKIVPIVLASFDLKDLSLIADSIALAVKETSKKMIVIASSDMTHYEEESIAKEKDTKAIQAIVTLDGERLIKEVKRYSISMCGVAPCYVAINFAKKVGVKGGKLIKYQTSGEVSGDHSSVVGYAAIALSG